MSATSKDGNFGTFSGSHARHPNGSFYWLKSGIFVDKINYFYLYLQKHYKK